MINITKKDKHSIPKYEIIRVAIREDIRKGRVMPGDQLPPEVKIAERFSVNRLTARRALQELEAERLIKRQQGRGTFVSEIDNGMTKNKVSHLMFLFVESSPDVGSNLHEVLSVEKYLAGQDIGLSCASLSMEQLMNNQLPKFIESGSVDGVLVDGDVNKHYCYALKQLKLPFVVVGDHPVGKDVPQVTLGCANVARRAVEFLKERYDMPIHLVMESIWCYYLGELFRGYQETAERMGQAAFLQSDESLSGCQILDRIHAAGQKKFAIIATDLYIERIFEEYKNRDIDPRQNPLLVIGKKGSYRVTPEIKK